MLKKKVIPLGIFILINEIAHKIIATPDWQQPPSVRTLSRTQRGDRRNARQPHEL